MVCPKCEGDGEIHVGSSVPDDEGFDTCMLCGGTGVLPTYAEIEGLREKLRETEGNLIASEGMCKMAEDEVARLLAIAEQAENVEKATKKMRETLEAKDMQIYTDELDKLCQIVRKG